MRRIAVEVAEAGADGIMLADTVGYGQPAAIERVFRRVMADVAPLPVAAHFHDTRGLGLANVLAALNAGGAMFDASLGGLGGCPYAPGATGNIVIEDSVFMFEAMGFDTGIDLDRLVEVRKLVHGALPEIVQYGAIARAGLPHNFHSCPLRRRRNRRGVGLSLALRRSRRTGRELGERPPTFFYWQRELTMADQPISSERFAVLVDQAGLKLTAEQFDELRDGYRFIQRMQRMVRRPRDRAAEPAHIFVHPRAGTSDGPDAAVDRRGEPRHRRGSLSPVALTEAYLERIAALDGELHSYVLVLRDQALEAARAAAAQTGRSRGALHGIPIGLKDIYKTKGIRTTAGSRRYLDHVPDEDAETWVRLRDAGAILLGKQETHEFAIGGPDFTLPFEPARNPWNTAHYPAGSSSGSAAAVAAGLCAGAMGSDTGGSIRGPAAYCGIVGLKPTYGRVSRRGVFPLSYTLDHCGPLTRTVEDCAIMMQALAGYDPLDPASADVPVPDYRAALTPRLDGLRIGVVRHFHEHDAVADFGPESAPSKTYVAAFDSALRTLESLGARLSRSSCRH